MLSVGGWEALKMELLGVRLGVGGWKSWKTLKME